MTEETSGGQGTEPKVDAKAEMKGAIAQLEAMLDEYMVKKAPFALPLGLKEFLATVAPYLTLIGIVLGVTAAIGMLGLSTMFGPVAMMGGLGYGYAWGPSMIIALATMLISLILQAKALSGLFKRTQASWRLMFYVSLVQLIGGVLGMNLVSAIIGAIIGWYVLFQMKDMYKN